MKVTLALPPLTGNGVSSYGFWTRLRNRWAAGKRRKPKKSGRGGGALEDQAGKAQAASFHVNSTPLDDIRDKGVPTDRKRHPSEEPFISKRDYGKILFEFKDKGAVGFVDEKGDPLRIVDLYEHLLVLGGSGTGKTYSILQPLWEEWFRSTHLPDGPDRDAMKFGALVIEAKGDFRDKTWSLAQKYGRMDDVVFFGPTHRDVIYDMFGDPTESPLQLANKMLAMMKAFSGGAGTQDPFWDNAARKLFQSIFIMHRAVRAAGAAAETDDEREKYKTDPMSFHLLNLMLMDRGQPRNHAQVSESQQQFSELWNKYQAAVEELQGLAVRLSINMERINGHIKAREDDLVHCEKLLRQGEGSDVKRTDHLSGEAEGIEGDSSEDALLEAALAYEDETGQAESEVEPEEAREMEVGGGIRNREAGEVRLSQEQLQVLEDRIRHTRRSLGRLVEVYIFGGNGEGGLPEVLESLVALFTTILNTEDDAERGQASDKALGLCQQISSLFRKRVHQLDEEAVAGDAPGMPGVLAPLRVPRGLDELKELILRFIDAAGKMKSSLERLAKFQPVAPAMGALKTLLGQYEKILEAKGVEAQLDTIWAYFSEEYLNIANEKTAGSVAMVATNLVSIFVHPPYSEIFSSNATFNFNKAIDEGKIVYLDMPSSYYGAAATVSSIAFKIDFFRCMLSRPRLAVRNPDGTMGDRLVNQDRPMSYFCDEFASIVSTGDETGEAGFMDKVREFKCGCLLGTQSIPMLLKKISEHEVDAILTNTACKIFLRNTDVKTNEYASKILGSEVKVNSNLNQGAAETMFGGNERPVGARAFSTNYSRGARYDVGEFTKLQKGQAIVVLNPRFGKHQIQKLSFKGKAVPPPDQEPPWNIPTTHPY